MELIANEYIIFIYMGIFLVLIKVVLPTAIFNFRKGYLYYLTKKNKYNEFFINVNRYLSKENDKKNINSYIADKAVLYMVIGEFKNALDNWEKIDVEKFSNVTKYLYYYNKILTLFELGRVCEAKLLLKEQAVLIRKFEKAKKYKISVKNLLAICEFYFGCIEKSEKEFLILLDNQLSKSLKSSIYLYLGRIALKKPDARRCKIYLNEAIKYGKGGYVEKSAKQLLAINK